MAEQHLSPRLTARLQHETATEGTQGSIPQQGAIDPDQVPATSRVLCAGLSADCSHATLHETAPCEVQGPRYVLKSYVERSARRWVVYDQHGKAVCEGIYHDEWDAQANADRRNRAGR